MRASKLLLLLPAALSGCTSYMIAATDRPPLDPRAGPPAGLGQVCVVRPHVAAALVPVVVRDNDQLVGGTRGKGYFCYFAEPGAHHVTTEGGDDIDRKLGTSNVDATDLAVAAGGRYYLHESLGNLYGVGPLQWVDEKTGLAMISECPYELLEGVPASEHLPGHVALATVRRASP